jgi:iron complex transport system substrate-binding protein
MVNSELTLHAERDITPHVAPLFAILLCSALCAAGATNAGMRVITFSPALTEIACVLGADAEIIGVGDFTDFPAAARAKPRLGGVLNPHLERMTVLRPTLIIAQTAPDVLRQFCAHYEIALDIVPIERCADITNAMLHVGRRLARAQQAQCLSTSFWQRLHMRRAPTARVPVLVSLWRTPGTVAGCTTISRASFLAEILQAIGASNVCADVPGPYPVVAAEVLSQRRPAVIIELRPGEQLRPADCRRLAADWRVFREMPAVCDQRIYFVTNSAALIPGPRVTELADELAALLRN